MQERKCIYSLFICVKMSESSLHGSYSVLITHCIGNKCPNLSSTGRYIRKVEGNTFSCIMSFGTMFPVKLKSKKIKIT